MVLRYVGVIDRVQGIVKCGLEKCVYSLSLSSLELTRVAGTPLPTLSPRPSLDRTTLSPSIQRATPPALLLFRALERVRMSPLWELSRMRSRLLSGLEPAFTFRLLCEGGNQNGLHAAVSSVDARRSALPLLMLPARSFFAAPPCS